MSDTVSARDRLLFDLFTTALEGGINYWSSCSEYHWIGDDDSADLLGFYAVIRETEESPVLVDGAWVRVDRAVMTRGLRLASMAPWVDRLRWSSEEPPLVVTDDTDWDFDAGDADVIVQLGLFGKVVYG